MSYYLGIEFGSTRIKAVVTDGDFVPAYSGEYLWQSEFKNGIWTYDIKEAITGLKKALSCIKDKAEISAVGISGMMHGYLAFDKDWKLLTPFRTWQNTVTAESAKKLTALFDFNIPQRWSIAHLYQAILNGEEHIEKVAHVTTLAGYVHFLLTGVNAVGIGEASGMFPVDGDRLCYNGEMVKKFDALLKKHGIGKSITDLLPRIYPAGKAAGTLTKSGADMIDGLLCEGTRFAPPEGDAGTGMVATNSIAEKTGNVSAGTSIFSMLVLEKPLDHAYPEIDIVTTPSGKPVAMVHCNNCTADSNAWIKLIGEAVSLFGVEVPTSELYTRLYEKSLEGKADAGGVFVCNYTSGESITGLDSGMPLVARLADSEFSLANFMRASLYSSIATLKIGMEILEKENITVQSLVGHGGLFKTEGIAQKYLASALGTPVTCMKTAGEGGPYGMSLLAAFLDYKHLGLDRFLQEQVFKNTEKKTELPDKKTADGFLRYIDGYKKLLTVEKAATERFKSI